MDIGYPLLPYLLSETLSYGMVGGAGYLAWRFVRAYERRSGRAEALESLTSHIARLDDAVERIDEAQRFTTQLLFARGGGEMSNPHRETREPSFARPK